MILSIGMPSNLSQVLDKKNSNLKIVNIPTQKIGEILDLNLCSEDTLNTAYQSKRSYNKIKKGLKQLQIGLKSYTAENDYEFLIKQIFTADHEIKSSPACLVPLTIVLDDNSSVEKVDYKLLLGKQSLACRENSSFIDADNRGEDFYLLSEAINNHISEIIKSKKIKSSKQKLRNLKSKRNSFKNESLKNELVAVNKKIRKYEISLASDLVYAQYGQLLSTVYESICSDLRNNFSIEEELKLDAPKNLVASKLNQNSVKLMWESATSSSVVYMSVDSGVTFQFFDFTLENQKIIDGLNDFNSLVFKVTDYLLINNQEGQGVKVESPFSNIVSLLNLGDVQLPPPTPLPTISPSPTPIITPNPSPTVTPSPPSLINGFCGNATQLSYTTLPTSNLCLSGIPSSINSTNDLYIWNCQGLNGGNADNCSAVRINTNDSVELNRSTWSIHGFSSQEILGDNNRATNAIDSTTNTFWHTSWLNGQYQTAPYYIDINLNGTFYLTEFRYLPRQSSPNGRLAAYEIFVSSDGINWGSAVASGSFVNSSAEQTVAFNTPQLGRYIRLQANQDYSGASYISVAEIYAKGIPTSISCQGPQSQSCNIINGVGLQIRSCKNDQWSSWGTCNVSICNNGYLLDGNSCLLASTLVSAGNDQTIMLPNNSVNLVGTVFANNVVTQSWTKLSGGVANLSGQNTNRLAVSGLVAGTYVFRFSVTLVSGGVAFDDVQVVINSSQGNKVSKTFDWSQVSKNVDGSNISNLAGYRVYMGTAPKVYGVGQDVGLNTSLVLSNLNVGSTYYVAVAAYNSDGLESSKSPEVVFTASN